jgi:hypothetical protein
MAADAGGYLARPAPSGLADVIEIVLDKGIVIDAYVRVSVLGIELLTFDARIVVASVDTYLRFAEATNRLDLDEHGGTTLPDLLEEGVEGTVRHVATEVVEDKVTEGVEKVEDAAAKLGPVGEAAVAVGEKVAGKLVDAMIPDEQD